MSSIETQKPFSMDYVLRVTVKNMRQSVDTSIRKTFDRVGEFADNQQMSHEIFQTLGLLHTLRKQLDQFQELNNDKFKGK